MHDGVIYSQPLCAMMVVRMQQVNESVLSIAELCVFPQRPVLPTATMTRFLHKACAVARLYLLSSSSCSPCTRVMNYSRTTHSEYLFYEYIFKECFNLTNQLQGRHCRHAVSTTSQCQGDYGEAE